MKKLAWSTVKRRIGDLIPFAHNPRMASDKFREILEKLLKKFGLVEIPAIDLDGTILAGHQRIKALLVLYGPDYVIEVRIPNRRLTKSEREEYVLASNRAHADWDYETLSRYFDMETMLVSGFDDSDLAAIFADQLEAEDDDFDVEAELKKIKKPKAKLGDIYQLGPHKLICGDSLDPATVANLVGETKIDMIYCDPIYNISLDYNSGVGGKALYGGKVNDSKTDDEYRAFIKKSMENALNAAKPDCHAFYWCDQRYIGMMQALFSELGLDNKRVCLWIKGPANPVSAVAFNKCYEPCVYAVRGKPFLSPVHLNFSEVLNKETGTGNKLLDDLMDILDIWLAKRIAGQEYEHSTQKPITLHEKAIKRCTKPGGTILDLFGGSGSTLICADALKRVCFMSEIEPIFIDLIIRRYEHYAQIKARKLN